MDAEFALKWTVEPWASVGKLSKLRNKTTRTTTFPRFERKIGRLGFV